MPETKLPMPLRQEGKSRKRAFFTLLGRLVFAALGILIIVVCLVIIIATARDPRGHERLVPARDMVRDRSLLKKHGLLGIISAVEVRPADGTLWIQRDGQLCQLK